MAFSLAIAGFGLVGNVIKSSKFVHDGEPYSKSGTFPLRKVPLFYFEDPLPPNSNSSVSFSSILLMNLLTPGFARNLYF